MRARGRRAAVRGDVLLGRSQDAYKYAARVFGVVSRVAVGMEEAFGSYEAPDTVRHHEDEDQEEEGAIGRS